MRKLRSLPGILSSILLLPALVAAQRPSVPAGLTVYVTGDPADAAVAVSGGPCALLMGGGTDVDAAFRDWVFPRLPGGDVVIIRATGSDGYNDYMYTELTTGPNRPNSVETMLLDSRAKSDTTYAEWVLDTAEFIFMAGGDQSRYMNYWLGTRTGAALNRAWQRGAIVGGTSAGMAVMGQFVYDPDGVTAATTATAIANPYSSGVIISDRLINAPILDGIITDTHFFERTRMGRPMAFLARLRQDGRSPRPVAICANEATALFIDGTGLGTVVGETNVYVLREETDTVREQVVAGQPLIYRNVRRAKLRPGDTIRLPNLETSVPWMPLSVDGRTASAPFTPRDPYMNYTAPSPSPTASGTATASPSPSPSPEPSPTPIPSGWVMEAQ